MRYNNCHKGKFIRRVNRFIAEVEVDGLVERVHVKNTGRCKELFIEGVTCYLEKSDNPDRKTRYSLIVIEKNGMLINIDSQVPNKVIEEALLDGLIDNIKEIKREVTYGASRFDVKVTFNDDSEGFIEVKGVTLEEEGIVRFPDAPTSRGTKHVMELIDAKEKGYFAMIAFVVQLEDCEYFTPNKRTDPVFSAALKEAQEKGVEVRAFTCKVSPDTLTLADEISVHL